MKYNFCKNCGSPVQPGMPNCQRCGAPVDQIQPVDENKPMAQPPGMLRQYYGDNNGNNQPNSNVAQPVPQQSVQQGQPMGQQPVGNQPPMGQPMGMNNNMQQPMNQQPPMGQPMGQPMGGPMPVQPQAGKDNSTMMAAGGIACAVIAFFIFWWLSFVSISLGVSGMSQAKVSNNNTGKTLCIVSIVLGAADIILFILGILGVFTF